MTGYWPLYIDIDQFQAFCVCAWRFIISLAFLHCPTEFNFNIFLNTALKSKIAAVFDDLD